MTGHQGHVILEAFKYRSCDQIVQVLSVYECVKVWKVTSLEWPYEIKVMTLCDIYQPEQDEEFTSLGT